MNRNPVQVQWAKQTAKRLFKRFSFQGNQLGAYELSSMIGETYQHLNIGFKSNSNDTKSMSRVLDANNDGKVTYEDFQEMCIRYLCDGINLGSLNYSPSREKISSRGNQLSTSAFQNTKTQSVSYGITGSQGPREIFDKYSAQNQNSVQSSVRQENSYTTIDRTSPKGVYSNTIQHNQHYTNQTVNNRISSNVVNATQQHSTHNQQYEVIRSQNQSVNATQSANQSLSNTDNRQYNSQVRQYLEMARNIFYKHAIRQSQTITANEVPNVLSETYAALGRQGYRPTKDDVIVWMKLCDGNEDGHVQYEEYQYFVVRSLERSGIDLYES